MIINREELKINIEKFFVKFWDFLKNIFTLFKRNYKEVFFHTVFCASFSLLATSIIKNIFFNLIMRVNNTTYIVPNNLKQIITNPLSIILYLTMLVLLTYISLFQIAGLLHAFSIAKIGGTTDFYSMVKAGFKTCKKASNPKNWLVILFLAVLFPLAKFLPLSSSTFKLVIPSFILQAIDSTSLYTHLYRFVYFSLICLIIVYIFAINIFVLQNSGFIKSCNRSRRLGKGHYVYIFWTMALLTIILNITINSLSSIIIINIREGISLFQKYSGIVTKSSQIGSYTYVLRQIMKSLFSPVVNNAALTVLYFKYMEQKDLIDAIPEETFKSYKTEQKMKDRFVIVSIIFFTLGCYFLVDEYAYLYEAVDEPIVCAHRGDNVNAPENTMPAFELAAKENLSWIELDVHQTSDGIIVCNHDSSLKRVTGTDMTIHDNPYSELVKLKMGKWMPGDYKDVSIPTLSEVLRLAKDNGMYVQVELKGHPDDKNFEENVLRVINYVGMHDQVMIIAQDARRLMRIKELDPTILKGYCMATCYGQLEDIPFTDNVSIEESNVTPDVVYRLHQKGKKVFCWTVDSEDTIQYLVSCGVDVIGTDNPTLVSNALDYIDYNGGFTRAFHVFMNALANMDK